MQKFDLLRYLKRFGLLVLAVTIAGTALVYVYCRNNQTYTAKAVIRYTNDKINEGLNPDGTELDTSEIYSSTVIAQAMDALGQNESPNLIRSSCYVKGIVPDDEKTKQEALLDKGEEVTYVPDMYEVGLTVNSNRGGSYASNMLDAILQSYFTVYTEKHVEEQLEVNPTPTTARPSRATPIRTCATFIRNLPIMSFPRSTRRSSTGRRSSTATSCAKS